MNLYSPPNGDHPQELPDRWRFADGTVRTDLKSLTNAELLLLYWTGPITQPQPFTEELDEEGNPVIVGDYDGETHKAVWYRAVRNYIVIEKHIDEAPYDSGELVSITGGIADWNTFKQSAVASVLLNTFVGQLISIAPVAATALPATLLLIESGNYQDFENTWTAIENATTVPADLITEMTALAESCNLPEEFVNIFAT